MTADLTDRPSTSLYAFAWFHAFWVFFLIIAGGLVTSTGSALAVPDWPLSFGKYFPEMTGGVFYEHGHRMIAGIAGVLTLILAVWLQVGQRDRLAKTLGWASVGVVVAQAVLGGVGVLLKLPPVIVTGHAVLGQTYFTLIVAIAILLGSGPGTEDRYVTDVAAKIRRLSWLTIGFIYFQLVAGAIYRHTGKGLHVHFLGAALVTIHIVLLARRILKDPEQPRELRGPAVMLLSLLGVQLVLGFYSWRLPLVWITTSHVGNGALVLATTAIIALQAYRYLAPSLRVKAS